MEMILYKTVDNENVINKNILEIHRLNIELKRNVSVNTPTITLNNSKTVDLLTPNYCYLTEFNRFYFIRDITTEGKLISLDLECDVLESFKDDILNSISEYSRKVKTGEYQQFSYISSAIKNIDLHYSDVTLTKNKSLVLTTVGGI